MEPTNYGKLDSKEGYLTWKNCYIYIANDAIINRVSKKKTKSNRSNNIYKGRSVV